MKHQNTFNGFESEKVLCTGSTGLRDSFKANNLGLVRVRTATGEFAIAYLLRNDEDKQIRIGVCVPQKSKHYPPTFPNNDDRSRFGAFGWPSHSTWQVVAVSRNSITEMQRLS